jgi:NAD(P)-dependent dehydrogenase (short-subunit alcohol dehydrogenase family)
MWKRVLITGTSSGFGKLTAITLAKEGHSVIAGMRGVNGKNAAVAKELSAIPDIAVIELDVASEDSVNLAVHQIITHHGNIDVVVNNAGVAGFGIFEATTVGQMKHIFEVNLFGVVRTCQAVLPSMRQRQSGLIINISSDFGIFGVPFLVPYQMTKFGVEALTEGLRHEIKRYGIEIVSILPGPFPTEIGGKAGFGPDEPDIVEAYGNEVQTALTNFGQIMSSKMQEYKNDPQMVANTVLALVNMQDGTRPYQTPVNPIAQEIENDLINIKVLLKGKWLKKFGWEAY